LWDSLLFMHAVTALRSTTKFDVVIHMERVIVLGDQLRSHPKVRDPSAPQFWGFLSIVAYTLCRRTTRRSVL